MSKSIIKTEGVTVSFGDFQALKGIDVDIQQGEIIVVLGPSGSGKSTFIRTLNRLQPHDGGRVVVDGVEINEETTIADLKRIRSEIGFVFQQFELFPHLTVLENIALAPQKVKGMSKREENFLESSERPPYRSTILSFIVCILVIPMPLEYGHLDF